MTPNPRWQGETHTHGWWHPERELARSSGIHGWYSAYYKNMSSPSSTGGSNCVSWIGWLNLDVDKSLGGNTVFGYKVNPKTSEFHLTTYTQGIQLLNSLYQLMAGRGGSLADSYLYSVYAQRVVSTELPAPGESCNRACAGNISVVILAIEGPPEAACGPLKKPSEAFLVSEFLTTCAWGHPAPRNWLPLSRRTREENGSLKSEGPGSPLAT